MDFLVDSAVLARMLLDIEILRDQVQSIPSRAVPDAYMLRPRSPGT